MNATTVGVDLAKNVFELALADDRGHILERQRLSRARFDRFFVNRAACRIVMEACGSAHHHARRLSSQGHDVVLLPAPAAGADKPITNLASTAPSVIGSASATLMMSRAALLAHQQDGYTNAAALRASARRDQIRLLDG